MPKLPTFRVQPLRIPPFTLDSLDPQMGVNTPSSRGLFPLRPSEGFGKSAWPAAPAENLAPLASLEPDRAAQREIARRMAMLHLLAGYEGIEPVEPGLLKDFQSTFPEARLPNQENFRIADLLGALRVP